MRGIRDSIHLKNRPERNGDRAEKVGYSRNIMSASCVDATKGGRAFCRKLGLGRDNRIVNLTGLFSFLQEYDKPYSRAQRKGCALEYGVLYHIC